MDIVYFIQAGGFIKIGKSSTENLNFRKGMMQTGCPYKMEIVGYVQGGHERERDLHAEFHEQRYRGEWFFASSIILEYIAKHSVACDSAPMHSYEHTRQKDFCEALRFAKHDLFMGHEAAVVYANRQTGGFLTQEDIDAAVSASTENAKKKSQEDRLAKDSVIDILSQAETPMTAREIGQRCRAVRDMSRESRVELMDELEKAERVVREKTPPTQRGRRADRYTLAKHLTSGDES